jgi:thiosulfate/3-mercaptopyruvate sulfurtransferase
MGSKYGFFDLSLTEHTMKNLIAGIAVLSLSTLTSVVLAAQPLLTPAELQTKLTDPTVRVIDIRDPKSYAANHVPGALSAPYGKWRGPAGNPGELPALNKLTELVQSLGITPDTHTVVVSSGANDTDFGATARVYWTLKVLGVNNLSILNGGVKAWQGAGLALSNNPVTVAKSDFTPTLDPNLIMTREQLIARVKTNDAVLVDARPAEFFQGNTRHVAAAVPGTLKNAVNVEHSLWFKPGTSQVVDASQAKSLALKNNLADQPKEIVSFCNTGHWAATNWFVLSELVGDPDVKLYAGSMVDWSQAEGSLPMDNVPNRFKQLVIDTKLWFANL